MSIHLSNDNFYFVVVDLPCLFYVFCMGKKHGVKNHEGGVRPVDQHICVLSAFFGRITSYLSKIMFRGWPIHVLGLSSLFIHVFPEDIWYCICAGLTVWVSPTAARILLYGIMGQHLDWSMVQVPWTIEWVRQALESSPVAGRYCRALA